MTTIQEPLPQRYRITVTTDGRDHVWEQTLYPRDWYDLRRNTIEPIAQRGYWIESNPHGKSIWYPPHRIQLVTVEVRPPLGNPPASPQAGGANTGGQKE